MEVLSFSGPKMKATRTIVLMGLFLAMDIVLQRFSFGPSFLKFGVGFFATALMGYYLGPWVAAVDAAMADQLGVLLSGGPNIPLYTLSAALAAFIYGSFFHNHKVTVWRVLVPVAIVLIFVNIGLGTWWLELTGFKWQAILPTRAVKNLIMIPIQTALTYAALRGVERIRPHL